MTIRDIAIDTGRSDQAVRAAADRLVKRGALEPREGRDWIFDERTGALVAAELIGRGGPGRKRKPDAANLF